MSWLDRYFSSGIHGVASDGVGLESQPVIDFGDGLTAVSDPISGTVTVTADASAATTGMLFAALRTEAATATPGQKLWLKGYSTPGDGGEGTFTVLDGGPFTDDGGTLAVPGGGTGSRCASRDYAGPLDPAWFGAVGDGSADDTAEIQRCCAALQARGTGSIAFTKPHAIFVSSHATPLGTFTGLTGVKLLCRGGSLILPAIEWATLGLFDAFVFSGCNDVVVDGFTCSGGTLDHSINVGSGVALLKFTAGSTNLSMPANRLSGAWTGLHDTANDSPWTEENRCKGITIGYLEVNGGTYGINGRHSFDDMTIGLLRTTAVYRSLFMVGSRNIRGVIDSADIAGSHDVIFAAQFNDDVRGVHVRYVHNRDSGDGITDANVGLMFNFKKPSGGAGDTLPTKLIDCSVELDVKLNSAFTLGLPCQVIKTTDGSTGDTGTSPGYTIDGLSISGVVDMNSLGTQGVTLEPTDNWDSGEFAANITLHDLAVKNVSGSNRAIWFNIARSLTGAMKVHNVTAPTDHVVELFGRNGAGPYYPPSDGLVSIRAVQCQNRFAQGAGNGVAIQQGAGVERVGGWSGISVYKDETQMALVGKATTDYLALGPNKATAGYLRFDRDGSAYALNSDRNANRRVFEYDSGNQLIVGDSNAEITTTVTGGAYCGITYQGSMRFKATSSGAEVFVGSTQVALFGHGTGDYIKLGANTPAAGSGVYGAAYVLMERDGGVCAYNSARNATRNLIGLDGGDQLFVGDSADLALNIRCGTTLILGYQTTPRIKLDSTGMGFFNHAPAAQQNITGALSTVADAPAKAVLTSIVAALVNLGLATDGTT